MKIMQERNGDNAATRRSRQADGIARAAPQQRHCYSSTVTLAPQHRPLRGRTGCM
jgi:hypothetical protein